jgi:hypothetical protein
MTVLIKWGNWTETQTREDVRTHGECYVKTEDQCDVTSSQPMPKIGELQKLGRGKEGYPYRLKGSMALLTPGFCCSLRNCEKIHFSCFEPPSL